MVGTIGFSVLELTKVISNTFAILKVALICRPVLIARVRKKGRSEQRMNGRIVAGAEWR